MEKPKIDRELSEIAKKSILGVSLTESLSFDSLYAIKKIDDTHEIQSIIYECTCCDFESPEIVAIYFDKELAEKSLEGVANNEGFEIMEIFIQQKDVKTGKIL